MNEGNEIKNEFNRRGKISTFTRLYFSKDSIMLFFYYFLILFFSFTTISPYLNTQISTVGGQSYYVTLNEFLLKNISFNFLFSIVVLSFFNVALVYEGFKKALFYIALPVGSFFILLFAAAFFINPYLQITALSVLGFILVVFPTSILGFSTRYVRSHVTSILYRIVIILSPLGVLAVTFSGIILPNNCITIDDPAKKVVCFERSAKEEEGSWRFCLEENNTKRREDCLFNFVNYSHEFVEEGVCQNIKENTYTQSRCYGVLALKEKDYTRCLKVENEAFRDQCLRGAINSRVVDRCEHMADIMLRDSCYFDVGYYGKDIQVCNLISTESSKQNCIENVERVLGN